MMSRRYSDIINCEIYYIIYNNIGIAYIHNIYILRLFMASIFKLEVLYFAIYSEEVPTSTEIYATTTR